MERSVVAPPTFVIPGREPSDEMREALKLLTSSADAADDLVKRSLELYCRQMLATSALRLEIPVPMLPKALSPRRIKRVLPASAARRLRFVDRGFGKWDAVEKYLKPALDEVESIPAPSEHERSPESLVREFMGHLYSISLSKSMKSPAIVPPVEMLELLDRLARYSLSSESQARLSVVRGVASCFQFHSRIPALVCEPRLAGALSERIDEILEDAYLLEASRLRTFFSPGANWAALRRDLRKILGWIVRNRAWARHAVRLGEQVVAVPGESGVLVDALTEMGIAGTTSNSPILLNGTHKAWQGGNTVIQVKHPTAVALFLP